MNKLPDSKLREAFQQVDQQSLEWPAGKQIDKAQRVPRFGGNWMEDFLARKLTDESIKSQMIVRPMCSHLQSLSRVFR